MSLFKDLYALLIVLVCFVCGLGVIYIGVYNCIIVPRIPKSKSWAKTRAKIVGKNDYTVKTRRSKYDFRSGFSYERKSEKIIEYIVDGKVYKKSVSADCKSVNHIYYKKSKPDYFKTLYEIKRHKRESSGAVMLILCFIMAAGFITAGIFCLLEFLGYF